jgi:hypothetical protein
MPLVARSICLARPQAVLVDPAKVPHPYTIGLGMR